MENKFLEAMTGQSMLMMKKACAGESLSKEEINFILLTQKLNERQERKQVLPQLVTNSQKFLPLVTSLFLGGSAQSQDKDMKENINE